MLQLTANGQGHEFAVNAETSLSCVLRNRLEPFGTGYGYGIAERSTRVLLLDAMPERSLPAGFDN